MSAASNLKNARNGPRRTNNPTTAIAHQQSSKKPMNDDQQLSSTSPSSSTSHEPLSEVYMRPRPALQFTNNNNNNGWQHEMKTQHPVHYSQHTPFTLTQHQHVSPVASTFHLPQQLQQQSPTKMALGVPRPSSTALDDLAEVRFKAHHLLRQSQPMARTSLNEMPLYNYYFKK